LCLILVKEGGEEEAILTSVCLSVTLAILSKARAVLDRSKTEIRFSNTARGMDVCSWVFRACGDNKMFDPAVTH
jgi:hypothetical protein